jgi:N-acetylmuramoyl-L-alanine amidase
LPASPQELFERAETLYRQLEIVDPSGHASSWRWVADAFNDVALRYPESPFASEALWRVSGIYGRRVLAGDETAAIYQREIYRDLVQRYSASPHAPEALLRLAIDAEVTDSPRVALLYSRLLQRYPRSPQAKVARNRMNELVLANNSVDLEAVDSRDAPRLETSVPPTNDRGRLVAAVSDDDPFPVDSGLDGLSLIATSSDLARLTGVRHYSDPTHTRVVLDLDRSVQFQTGEVHQPERLFIDLQGVDEPGYLAGAEFRGHEQVVAIEGGAVARARIVSTQPGVVRVVMDFSDSGHYTLFTLGSEGEPFRIVVDVPTASVASRVKSDRRPPKREGDSISEQLGLGVQRVVLDPGHGGTDPGAIGRTGVAEKWLTLQLSLTLAERLRATGYEVLLTRQDDSTLTLQKRTEFANGVAADVLISIHINSARNRKLRGFETYYLDMAIDPIAAETAARENASGQAGSMGDLGEMLEAIIENENKGASSELASSIQDSLVMHVAKNYGNVHDLGVKTAPFFVLVGADMPAVLVEASFVSNEEEEAWLKSAAYRSELAEAIEIGLQSYIDKRRVATDSYR